MQTLPVILAVIFAAAAIIAVLFWRLKPQSTADLDAAENRVRAESEKVQALQAKAEGHEKEVRAAIMAETSAKAALQAAEARVAAAETHRDRAVTDLTALQTKYNQSEPAVATATAEKEAADKARAELEVRHADLTTRHTVLETNHGQMLGRATNAEAEAIGAKSEADAVRKRAEAADIRLDEVTGKLNILHADLSHAKSSLAQTVAQRDAADVTKVAAEKREAELSSKFGTLQQNHDTALTEASASKANAQHLRKQVDDLAHTLEIYTKELTEERAKLNQALAKQQSDEDAARHFESISQTVLKEALDQAKQGVGKLAATFQKTSGDELAKHADKITKTLEPLQAQLVAYDAAVESLKKGTQENYGNLREQLEGLQKAERALHDQAQALTDALSGSPKVKGKYGEMMLKQLVEFVGMQEKCHFELQSSYETEEGRRIPDLVVFLPGGQKVIVDAKAVMDACVEAQKATDPHLRKNLLQKHCTNVRSRVDDLSSKQYFSKYQDAVEAVVLFLPAENLYATAMENDPGLTEYAMGKNIILCGPNSLMLLLKVSNQLWRRAAVEKEVSDIRDCGEKIYKAACDFAEKFAGIGRKIQSLETEYNGAVATFEGRLLPAGKRMSNFESVAGNKQFAEVEPLKDNVREFKEATNQLKAVTPKLTDLAFGDETAEMTFITTTEAT